MVDIIEEKDIKKVNLINCGVLGVGSLNLTVNQARLTKRRMFDSSLHRTDFISNFHAVSVGNANI